MPWIQHHCALPPPGNAGSHRSRPIDKTIIINEGIGLETRRSELTLDGGYGPT
jgi:hypothetical protein